MTIPDSVTTIQQSTFSDCSRLTSIFLPDSIVRIGRLAFSSCKSLTSITIPQSVKELDPEAFKYCDKLIENSKGLYYVDTWIIDVVDSSMTTAVIKDKTRGITHSAFLNCNKLTNIYITDLAAWCNISGLNYIMSGSTKKIYLNNKLITSLTIPDGITNIASCAFYNYCELTSVEIPDSVTSIGNYAFSNCSNLESITIPDNLTINKTTFSGCNNLKNATLPTTAITYLPTNPKITLEKVILTVGEIPSYAFYGCPSLKSVEIRDKVTAIGEAAFRECSELTYLTIGNGVTSIGLCAFFNCNKLDNVTIPKSIVKIEKYAFNCNLTSIYYDGDLTSWCKIEGLDGLLNSDTTPENLYINGKEITIELVLPDEITEIKNNAFFGCSKIISITIPDTVKSIGSSAFEGCNKLVYIEFKGTIEQWKAVSKSSGWNSGTGNYVVHCTNGNINK